MRLIIIQSRKKKTKRKSEKYVPCSQAVMHTTAKPDNIASLDGERCRFFSTSNNAQSEDIKHSAHMTQYIVNTEQ